MSLYEVCITNNKGEVLKLNFASKNAQLEMVRHCRANNLDFSYDDYGSSLFNMRNIQEAIDHANNWKS